jgi:hypothetical protein
MQTQNALVLTKYGNVNLSQSIKYVQMELLYCA